MRDVDPIIISFMELRDKLIMGAVNKYFEKLITNLPRINQWRDLFDEAPVYKFSMACSKGYLEYAIYLADTDNISKKHIEKAFSLSCKHNQLHIAKWLLNEYPDLDIHSDHELAFRSSCENGHIDIAKWLVDLGGVNIHTGMGANCSFDYAFRWSCIRGYMNIAKWLIELGESSYGKVDIHAAGELAFILACQFGRLEMAKWLIGLSENYGKIDIHAGSDSALVQSHHAGNLDVVRWLIELSNGGYGAFDERKLSFVLNDIYI